MITPKSMGFALNTFRKERNLTQKVLSNKTKLTVNYISLLETGRRKTLPSIETVNKIAKALGVKSSAIFVIADHYGGES